MDGFALAGQIRCQPAELERLLADPAAQDAANAAAAAFTASGRVDVVGIGTSHNAALTAAYLLRAAGLDATAWSSYDYTLYGAGSETAGGKPLLLLSVRSSCCLACCVPGAHCPAELTHTPRSCSQHTGGKQFSRRAFQGPEGGTPPTSVFVVTGDQGERKGDEKKGLWEPELEHSRGTVMFRTCSQESSAMYTVSHLTAMIAVAMMAEAVTPGCLGGASVSTQSLATTP